MSHQLISTLALMAVSAAVAAAALYPMRMNAEKVAIPAAATRPAYTPIVISAALIAMLAATANRPAFAAAIVVVPLLVWLAWIDLRSQRIPTVAVHVTSAVTVAVTAALWIPELGLSNWIRALLVGLAAAGVLLAAALVTGGKAIGAGDVRVAFPLGVLVGVESWSGLWATFIFALLVMFPFALLSLLLRRRKTSAKTTPGTLPLAPALVMGAVIALMLAP